MDNKVKRTLVLLAISAVLFVISEFFHTSWTPWIRGASAGLALGGVFSVVLIFADELKRKK
ncbi:hypothetical protein HQ865_22510 [Mucilaginibacter mali]|uniref:Uncharacterized protein n=1 Tax=Mucilaginibacter mali TaxID=2740462 RepID=A0A7D4UGX1_9SPHI|nr:hypothetical protein [Mucilaginibacter mali]QKJ32416.1 hypothetical protein HQ865_22510 [Mucilaginibacter mali]